MGCGWEKGNLICVLKYKISLQHIRYHSYDIIYRGSNWPFFSNSRQRTILLICYQGPMFKPFCLTMLLPQQLNNSKSPRSEET